MGLVIFSNIQVFPGPYLHKPGLGLYLSGAGGTSWQALASKTYASGWSGGINTGDAGILEGWIGRRDSVFG